nr:MAG TPA: hypothetical protein [Caudoviricetes sp.]
MRPTPAAARRRASRPAPLRLPARRRRTPGRSSRRPPAAAAPAIRPPASRFAAG